MARPIKPQVIKLSSLDVHAPAGVQIIFRLQHQIDQYKRPPVVIADHTDIKEAQEHSDRLSASGIRHNWVTWWRKDGRHVAKWPTMMHGKRRHFRVSVPYVQGISDARWKEAIKDGIYYHTANYLSEDRTNIEDIRVRLDEERNRGERNDGDPDLKVLRDFFDGVVIPSGSAGASVYVRVDDKVRADKALAAIVARLQH